MARYIDADKVHELVENRQGKGDCKFCNKYERCVKNGINRKGSHLYCWEEIKLPTADVVEVVRCINCESCFLIGENDYYCDITDKQVHEEHFCGYGFKNPNKKEGEKR